MKKRVSSYRFRSWLSKLETFFASWHFPVFMLSVLFFFAVMVITITFIPVSNSPLGTFAEEFKTWCLGYDPATGEIESIYLVMFIVQPTLLSIFIWIFWYSPLVKMIKVFPSKAVPHIAVALLLVTAIGMTLPSFNSSNKKGELPFPAESLRTGIKPPDFTLINQDDKKVTLDNFHGEVVMLTAVYASCNETCPMILEQAKNVRKRLNEEVSEKVHLMALTMDPGKDTARMLKMTADHYELTGANDHLLTGKPEYVNDILDRLNIPRRRRQDGAIDHANIFILIDKQGKIAYRFTLGKRQERWLLKATRLLAREPASVKGMSSLYNPSSILVK